MTPLNPVFSKLKPSSTLAINEAVNKRWQQGKQAFHMGFGESRFDVHEILRAALAEHSNKKSYLAAQGLPQLTQAVAGYYSNKLALQFKPEQVIVGPGSKLLIYALQMVTDADVFLPTPSWVSYAPQASLLGNQHFYIPSRVEDSYRLDLCALEKCLQKSNNPNKMLIINSPNNPTGQMLSETELRELADFCRAKQIWVLSDEIYFQVCHGEVPHGSIAGYYPEGTFVLGGLSKHLSIGGWRLGVALLPDTAIGKQIMQGMATFASETWSGVAAPIQYAAIEAYNLNPELEQYVADCSTIHGIRSRHFRDGLVAMGVNCSRVEGAFYIAANFDKFRKGLSRLGVATSRELANYLLEEHHIASLPGSDFGFADDTLTLRLSTSYLDMEQVGDSHRLMALFKSAIHKTKFMSEANHPNTHAALAEFRQLVQSLSGE